MYTLIRPFNLQNLYAAIDSLVTREGRVFFPVHRAAPIRRYRAIGWTRR